jgi:cytochrome c peroxidase
MSIRWRIIVVLIGLSFAACRPDEVVDGVDDTVPPPEIAYPNLPNKLYDYTNVFWPGYFDMDGLGSMGGEPEDNPTTDAGATLGRVLFYDKNLSINRTISCGSCHQQEHGFADPNAKSIGHGGGLTKRNASHIVNLIYGERFFWDGLSPTLEEQVLVPIQNNIEMGLTLSQLVERVRGLPYYPALFEQAFGTDQITSNRIAHALAQFVRSIVSYQTRYDEALQNDFTTFIPVEWEGKSIFFNTDTKCDQCHSTANFFSNELMNDGLDVDYFDEGLGSLTGNPADNGKFKVPSLRNVMLTAPYMHDGRFATIDEVIAHYSTGVQPHANLDLRLTTEGVTGGTPSHQGFSESQAAALKAFLATLTDEPLINDPKFSDPFLE